MGAFLTRETGEHESAADKSPAVFILGLEEAPAEFNNLLQGGIYSLHTGLSFGQVSFISCLLRKNMESGSSCALITPMSPENFLQRCHPDEQKELHASLLTRRLLFLTMVGNYKKSIVRLGVRRFLRELERWGVTDGSLLVIDQAEQIFSLQHRESALDQLRIYAAWLEHHQCTALMMFSSSAKDSALAGGLLAITEKTNGSAYLEQVRDGTEVWVDFWQSSAGVLAERRILINSPQVIDARTRASVLPLMNRMQTAHEPVQSIADELRKAPDADDVYCLGSLPIPVISRKAGRWVQAESLVGLMHAVREARAATVLIVVARDSDWMQLAKAIHTMRLHSGPMLRIVILDPNRNVRYQHEALLLQVGANTVVHGAADLGRLPLLLESLHAQLYVRSASVNFEEAISSVQLPQIKGYLPPQQFAEKVRGELAQARALELPCALITLSYPPGQDLSAAVSRFVLSRQGDLLTTCPTQCLIFLYGCMAADVQVLLPRLLGLHHSLCVGDISCLSEEETIMAALVKLEAASRQDAMERTPMPLILDQE